MKTRFSKLSIAALSLGFFSTGAYSLITSDALLVGHRKAVSVEGQQDQGLPMISSSEHAFEWEARLRELDRKMVALRNLADSASEPTGGRIHQLSLEIASLRSGLDKLAEKLEGRGAGNEFVSGREELNLTEEEKEAMALQKIEAQVATYDELGIREGPDPDWSLDAQEQLYDAFEALREQGIGVGDVVCHTSFCQADFTVESDSGAEIIHDLQNVGPWGGERLVWIKDVEKGAGVMYVARDGGSLPNDG